MRLLFSLLLSFLFLVGCQNSAFVQTSAANETMSRMNKLQRGMSTQKVRALLGCPKKIANKTAYGQPYTVWYYVTQGVVFSQPEYYQVNFTPIVFRNDKLFGWGKAFHYNLFRPKTATLGERGGEKNDVYYFKTKKNKQPEDTKSIEEILEEIHEEKSFEPLDKNKATKDIKKESRKTEENQTIPTSKKTTESNLEQQDKKEAPAPDWDEDEYLKDESDDKRPVFWE